jgi:CBS domain containing-hemolysin-like protein
MFLYILLTLLTISAFLVNSTLFSFLQINAYALKAKAQAGDKEARKLYPIHKQGYDMLAILIIKTVVIHIALVATIIAVFPVIAIIIISPVLIIMNSLVLPLLYADRIGLFVLVKSAGWTQRVLNYSPIVTKPLSRFVEKRLDLREPRLLGSKQELYKLLEKHTESNSSSIADHEIELVRHALDFSSKQVRDFMTPRRVVKRIAANDEVGPILIDELHKSGHSRFPVYDDKNVESFIGVLFLRDLVDVRSGGPVEQFMKRTVSYVHEEESLYYALHIILQTNHQLLVVVNTFEEFIGVISTEDIIEEIIGAEIVDEFDQHDNLRAVAARIAAKEAKKHAPKDAITDKK